MKYSELSLNFLNTNGFTLGGEEEKKLLKELRTTLRLEYNFKADVVRKMNDNKVIETYYNEHSKHIIRGQ
jgi:hypothetical protein